MPTLQEEREQYNNKIKANMDYLLHGDTGEVAKAGLQRANDYKSDAAENRRYVGAAQENAQGGLNRAYAPEKTKAEATYAPSHTAERAATQTPAATNSAATATRHNALRAEPTENYRLKYETNTTAKNSQAAPSAYDGINDTIRNNPRHLGTPVLGSAAATTAERRAQHSREAKDAFAAVANRTEESDSALRLKDLTPNAVQNRQIENTVTITPSPDTRGYERIVISNQAIKESREAGLRSEKERQEASTGIPTQVKVIAAVIAAAIILAFTVIFINSALLNSLNMEATQLSAKLTTLSIDASDLQDDIEKATSVETIEEYAKEAGMIYIGD